MRIRDLLKKEAVAVGIQAASRSEALDLLVGLHQKAGNLSEPVRYQQDVLERESEGNTAIGHGIAIPHAKSAAVKRPGLAALLMPQGIDCSAPDGVSTRLFFMIAAPMDGELHIEILARLSGLLMDEAFRQALMEAENEEVFLRLLTESEEDKFPVEKRDDAPKRQGTDSLRLLAVTACPTGIAHTFLAAEALERTAEELGISLKAETNGADGARNVLTPDEISNADAIIIAADRGLDLSRFVGKRILQVSTDAVIHDPKKQLGRALEGRLPVYGQNSGKQEKGEYGEAPARRFYKHLMNGMSHMLPFVVGGGVLIALSYLLDSGSSGTATLGSNTPMAAFLHQLGFYAFSFMLPVLSAFIAESIADRPGLAVGFVGGFIANLGMTFMNPEGSVSAGFLGAMLAGFLSGWIVLGLKWLTGRFPDKIQGIRPVLIYPVAGILLIGVLMCLINPVMGMLNTGLTGLLHALDGKSRILLGALLAALMAVDLGGPVNKAAYVFGAAALAAQEYDVMAAVMIGGMVPPLATALAATFFKGLFTGKEQKAAPVNYVLGLCFITEGAIPFAAVDPLRVIPSCMAGSAVAGGLAMAMGCTVIAPHGGIFVFPLAGNVPGYFLALLCGSVVGMSVLVLLKRIRRRKTA